MFEEHLGRMPSDDNQVITQGIPQQRIIYKLQLRSRGRGFLKNYLVELRNENRVDARPSPPPSDPGIVR